jgi:hypothetical protein
MLQQNLDKFLSRKSTHLYAIGIPNDENVKATNNLGNRLIGTPVINIDFMVEATLFDTPNLNIEKFLKIVEDTWIKSTANHKRAIVEGCTPLFYNTIKNNDSIVVLNSSIKTWLPQLRKFRLHTLVDFLEKGNNLEERFQRFSQGKNLLPMDNVNSLFLKDSS